MIAAAKSKVAQVSAGMALFAGPVLAGVESTGALHEVTRPFMVYVLSAALTLVGFMCTALLWFIKREHTAITTGIDGLKGTAATTATQVAAIAISVERGFAELRGEVSRRVLIEEHGRSSARVHEKVNRLDRQVAFLSGKFGIAPTNTPPGEREPEEGSDA